MVKQQPWILENKERIKNRYMENVLRKLAFSLLLMYCNKAAKKNMPYKKTSLRSVTQATDSTLIGCKANKAVANAV